MKKKLFDLQRSDLGKNILFSTEDGKTVSGTISQIHHLGRVAILTTGDGDVYRVEDPNTLGFIS